MKENCLWYWQKKRQGKCRKDSPELKDALLRRMLPPNNESITKISREEGISEQTLRNWRDKARKEGYAAPGTDAVPDDWSTQDKFLVVVETAGMNETELAEYARKKGLYIEQIKAWKDACMNANGGIAKEASRLNRELKDSEKERRKLEKELQRKHFLSGLCQTYSQVRTGCCFANAAFLVGDGDDLCVHDFTSFLIVAVVSGNRKSRHFKINSEVTALSIAGIRVPEMKKAPSIYTVCYIKFIFNYSN